MEEQEKKQQLMDNKKITLDQVDVLLHALGHPKYYRNYFAADHGSHDWEDIQTLVLCGMMEKYITADKDSGLEYYRVTEHGKNCLGEVGLGVWPTERIDE
jgi:hypothetical protein